MKILLATDGSPCSDTAVDAVARRPWPEDTEVKVLNVIHAPTPEVPDPFLLTYACHFDQLDEERKRAPKRVERAASRLRDREKPLVITTEVLEGSPKKLILDEAQKWGADLVVVGCHGFGPVHRFTLGSISHAVALYSPCSVEIVRATHGDGDPICVGSK